MHEPIAARKEPPEDYRQGFDLIAKADFITTELAAALEPSSGCATYWFINTPISTLPKWPPPSHLRCVTTVSTFGRFRAS